MLINCHVAGEGLEGVISPLSPADGVNKRIDSTTTTKYVTALVTRGG